MLKSYREFLCYTIVRAFPLVLFGLFFEQYITRQIALSMRDPSAGSIWSWGMLSLIWALLWPILFQLVAFHGMLREAPKLSHYLEQKASFLVVETIRVWGSCFRWFLLLIVPGFVRWVQLLLVPAIVGLHPDYDRGQVEVLSTSRQLAGRVWPWLLLWFVLFQLISPLLMSSGLGPYRDLLVSPGSAFPLVLIETLLLLTSLWFLARLFLRGLGRSTAQ